MIVAGDVHGEFEKLKKIISDHKIYQRNILQVGDFGLGFNSYATDIAALFDLNEFFQSRKLIMYVIRGNHDNKDFWLQSEYLNLSNLRLVKDFEVLNIEGMNVLFIGGGISPNRILLKEGINYWISEHVTADENRLTFNQTIDVIATHVAPIKFWPKEHTYMTTQYILKEYQLGRSLSTELWEERKYMDKVLFKFCPRHWFYGHYHENKLETIKGELGGNTTAVCVGKLCLYDYRSGIFMDHKLC